MATTQDTSFEAQRRLPKSFRLLRSAIALANECTREMLANLEAPDLAATGDRIDRIEEERRVLAASLEDHLHGALLSPIDPADLHALSASIATLTHRTARALYFFGLLGSHAPPPDVRSLARLLGEATAELGRVVDDLTGGRTRAIASRVHDVRRLRDESHEHLSKVLAVVANSVASDPYRGSPEPSHDLLICRTVGEAIDAASAQALAVAAEALRVATKHD